jgi:hypothetical protein
VATGSSYEWSYAAATPYEILGVSGNSSEAEIRSAWRKLSQFAHPDRGGTSALFVLTQEAYELLIDPVRRQDFDRHHLISRAGTSTTRQTSTTKDEDAARDQAEQQPCEPQPNEADDAAGDTDWTKSRRFSLSWFVVIVTNGLVATHYEAILAANKSGLTPPSHDSFMIMKPWHPSFAALTFLRGDLWIPYASMVFLAATALHYLLGGTHRAPHWLRRHHTMVKRTTLLIGFALTLPVLITGVLWGLAIAVTLALIALVIAVVIALLSIA